MTDNFIIGEYLIKPGKRNFLEIVEKWDNSSADIQNHSQTMSLSH